MSNEIKPTAASIMAAQLAKAEVPAALTSEQAEIAALKASLAEAERKLNAAPSTQPSVPVVSKFPKYIMPISNCNITLPSGKRIHTSDGVIVAETFELQQYLADMADCGNCTLFQEGDTVSSFQKPVV